MKHRKRNAKWTLLSLVLAAAVLLVPVSAAAQVQTVQTPDNPGSLNYGNTSGVVRSYLVPVGGGYMRVYARSSDLLVQYFDSKLKYVSDRSVPFELPTFGGFYASKSGDYYVLTGQSNSAEDDKVEVYRVTKYDSSWKRIGSAALSACNTTIPFRAGSARFAESGNQLFIHTSHQMYTSSDGLRHQSNLSFTVDMKTMTVGFTRTDVSNISTGYVSHSFNQFVAVDDDQVITVDLGDAYPRAIVLCRYSGSLSEGKPAGGTGWDAKVNNYNVINIAGAIGNNTTHAAVGGLAVTGSGYLVAGTSADQSSFSNTDQNVFLAYVPKDMSSSTIQWLTTDAEKVTYGAPHLVKVSDGLYAVLWTDYAYGTGAENKVSYQYFDGQGRALGAVESISGVLSDCVPVIYGERLCWFVNHSESGYSADSHYVDFYSIPLPGASEETEAADGTGKTGADASKTDASEGASSGSDAQTVQTRTMYRLYNPNSGEHFYTADTVERDALVKAGWKYEGEAWDAPATSNTPVYRVYNPNSGLHHYTTSAVEKTTLVGLGWKDEGIGWYSDDSKTTPLYRLYNPNSGQHHYTRDAFESGYLIGIGWKDEGIGWYGK